MCEYVHADGDEVTARLIAAGLLVAVGWPAVIMGVALLQERIGRRRR
jgi:hypothetical protein